MERPLADIYDLHAFRPPFQLGDSCGAGCEPAADCESACR